MTDPVAIPGLEDAEAAIAATAKLGTLNTFKLCLIAFIRGCDAITALCKLAAAKLAGTKAAGQELEDDPAPAGR